MKNTIVYERKGIFFIRTSSQTNAGVWIEDGDCYSIKIDAAYEEIGKIVFAALNNSSINIPHPINWTNVSNPLLKAVNVKSWSAFGKTAKCVTVYMDKNIQISPTENKSNCKQGFVVKENNIISIPINATHSELGKSVKEAWLYCE
jgi:hypothetical protein